MSNSQHGYLRPASPPSGQGRPSSRRALTKALELAQEAVRIDATGDDPQGAVVAYARSVALLNEVMERVMRGEDTDAARRKNTGRRKSVVAKEDEARRLRSIVSALEPSCYTVWPLVLNSPARYVDGPLTA